MIPRSRWVSVIRAFGYLLAVGVGLVACKKSAAEATPSPATSQSATAASSTAAAPSATPADLAPVPPPAMQSIPERFASEAKNRPAGTIRVEDAIAAFQGAGATLREQRQHLAAPFLAAYCVGAQTGEDVHFSVCEYKDAARAAEGKKMSTESFAAVPNRTLYQNGATTLTLRVGGTSEKDRELGQKLAQAFTALTVKK